MLEDVPEGDAEASLQAEGEDFDSDTALDGHSHAGADASVDGAGQGCALLLSFEGGTDGSDLLREGAEVVLCVHRVHTCEANASSLPLAHTLHSLVCWR